MKAEAIDDPGSSSKGLDPRSRILPIETSRPSVRHVCCPMAFPIPSHLPKKQPTDVSSAILGRISDAGPNSLSAALAEVWITELDESIRAAKVGLSIRLSFLIAQPISSNSSTREFRETSLLSAPNSQQPGRFVLVSVPSRKIPTSCPTQFPILRHVRDPTQLGFRVKLTYMVTLPFSRGSLQISSTR